MNVSESLKALADISGAQWGMVTAAQARERGVGNMSLTRMVDSGHLVRLAHGVYRDAGAPPSEHEELRVAWLAAEPKPLAWERLKMKPYSVVVSGESAAELHGLGNFHAMRSEFTTPTRKQTQRNDVRYRTRVLPNIDLTVREGLPVTTVERTIADLVEQRAQLGHVADMLGEAMKRASLDTGRLVELLSPLAERNGYSKGDGAALLQKLLKIGNLDIESLSLEILKTPELGALVAKNFLIQMDIFQPLNETATMPQEFELEWVQKGLEVLSIVKTYISEGNIPCSVGRKG